MKEELLKGLSEEQIARIKQCNSQEELLKVAKEEGIELTDEQLEAVSGGVCTKTIEKPTNCINCGSTNINAIAVGDGNKPGAPIKYYTCVCKNCGKKWFRYE